jgi:hypothetical protein
VRSSLSITPSTVTSEPGTIRPATSGKAADDGSPGTEHVGPGQLLALGQTDVANRRRVLDENLGPEGAQHALGVVAGGFGLDHLDAALGVQAGQQHGRLHLGRGHRAACRSDRAGCRPSGSAAGGPSRPIQRRAHLGPGDPAPGIIGRPRSEAVAGEGGAEAKPAAAPMIRRTPVPALPQSMTSAGSAKPPWPSIRQHPSPSCSTRAPKAAHGGGRSAGRRRLPAGPRPSWSPGPARPGSSNDVKWTCRRGRGSRPAGGRAGRSSVQQPSCRNRLPDLGGFREGIAFDSGPSVMASDRPLFPSGSKGRRLLANPELGAKQICPNCQSKFYDLGRRPAVCPKCESRSTRKRR